MAIPAAAVERAAARRDWISKAAEVISANLAAAMAVYAEATTAGDCRRANGFTMTRSGVRFAPFNATVIHSREAGANISAVAAAAQDYYRPGSFPWSLWVNHDLIEQRSPLELDRMLARCGLRFAASHPGMIAPALVPPSRELPPMEFRRVDSDLTRKHFIEICSDSFAVSRKYSQQAYGSALFWRNSLHGSVGYLEGRPAAIAAAISTGDAVGLYSIATSPRFRRRGAGEAIVRHAAAELTTQPSFHVLQSTPAGIGLYRRLGFENTTLFSVFMTR